MATHSSILTWEILWTEEPGGLQFMGLQRVGHDLETKQQQQCTLFQEVMGVNQLRGRHGPGNGESNTGDR